MAKTQRTPRGPVARVEGRGHELDSPASRFRLLAKRLLKVSRQDLIDQQKIDNDQQDRTKTPFATKD